MKKIAGFVTAFLSLLPGKGITQPIPKAVLVEHFTNSYCSICAGRNPGFYQNLAQFPQVLHIAYYPSAPYPACPINQYNKVEADARTNYYGVYGSTPQLAIQGIAIPANANYASASIFQSELGKTTAFALSFQLQKLSATTGEARLTIRKADTSSLDSVSVYAVIVEDTLQFAANNGEQVHYDVFRRSVWGTQPLRVKSPVAVGDSTILTQTFAIDAAWPLSKMYGIGILQQKTGPLLQVTRSNRLAAGSTTAIHSAALLQLNVHPNPAADFIYLENAVPDAVASIYDMQGRRVQQIRLSNISQLDVRLLAPGNYLLHLSEGSQYGRFYFTKQ